MLTKRRRTCVNWDKDKHQQQGKWGQWWRKVWKVATSTTNNRTVYGRRAMIQCVEEYMDWFRRGSQDVSEEKKICQHVTTTSAARENCVQVGFFMSFLVST